MSETSLDRRSLLKVLGGGVAGTVAATQFGAAVAAPRSAAPSVRTAAADQVTLHLLTWGSVDTAKQRDAALRKAYPELDQTTKVEFAVGGQGDFDVAKALRLALASGQNIPEMVQLNRTQVAEFAQAGELLDLAQIYAPVKADLYAGALELVQFNDKFVCFPFELKSKLFFYRTDLFQQSGIELASLKTFDDFITAGKALHAKFPKSYIINLGPQPAQYWMGEVLSAYPDVRFADQNGTFQITKNKAFADMFTFMKRLHDSGIALPVDDFSSDWQAAWPKEAIAGSLIANWMKFFLPKFAPKQGGKWQAVPWPALAPFADQHIGSEAGGSVYIVPKRSSHPEAAADYLKKMFLSKPGAMAIYSATGTTPLLKSAKDDLMTAVRSAQKPASMSDADWAIQPVVFFGPEYFDVELQSYDFVKIIPYDPAAAKEIPILQDWLYKYLGGKSDLAAALAGAENDMKSQIGNPYQQ